MREPRPVGRSLVPFLVRLNKHSHVFNSVFVVATDSSSSAGCIMIHHIPSALQSVFENVGLAGSYRVRTGDDVIHILMSLNNSNNS